MIASTELPHHQTKARLIMAEMPPTKKIMIVAVMLRKQSSDRPMPSTAEIADQADERDRAFFVDRDVIDRRAAHPQLALRRCSIRAAIS